MVEAHMPYPRTCRFNQNIKTLKHFNPHMHMKTSPNLTIKYLLRLSTLNSHKASKGLSGLFQNLKENREKKRWVTRAQQANKLQKLAT